MKPLSEYFRARSRREKLAAFDRLVNDHAAALFKMGVLVGHTHPESERLVKLAFSQVWASIDAVGSDKLSYIRLFRAFRKARRSMQPQPKNQAISIGDNAQEVDASLTEIHPEIAAAICENPNLSSNDKEFFLMQICGKFSSEEIASICEISIGAVQQSLYLTKRRLINV